MGATSRIIYEISENPGLCHCSSMEETTGGDLFCVWYEGAYEGAPGTAIRASCLSAGGKQWSLPRDLFAYQGIPLGNPVLFTLEQGGGIRCLTIIFSILLGETWTESVLFISRSLDRGESWSNPELLFPRKGLMAKTKPLVLASGRVLIPLYDEAGFYPAILVINKEEQWASGHLTAETMSRDIAIQPALAQAAEGRLLMLCRTSRGTIWKSISSNDGLSWSLCEPTGLPNPNSAIDLLKIEDKLLILAFNNSKTDRHSLSVALSTDSGESWRCCAQIDGGRGEYSYPSLTKDDRGEIHLSYTEDRYRIKHFQFNLSWLQDHKLEKSLITS